MEYFEDIETPKTWRFGEYTMKENEILEFRKKYDPIPSQIDKQKAKNSYFEGLIASGLHTLSITTKLFIENTDLQIIASPGFGDTKWKKPVRPKDTITIKAEITEKTNQKNKPGGKTEWKWKTYNQKNNEVMTTQPTLLIQTKNNI